jgi:hypothetical protein
VPILVRIPRIYKWDFMRTNTRSRRDAMNTHRTNVTIGALLVMASLLFPGLAFSQHEGPGQRYVFGSVGGWEVAQGTPVGGGFGYERVFEGGGGIGFEGEGFGTSHYGGGLFSADGSYHFRNPGWKVVPFGTAGYSGLVVCGYGCGGISGINFGGGVNYWIAPSRGLRLEFRDHVFFDDYAIHKYEARIGFSF